MAFGTVFSVQTKAYAASVTSFNVTLSRIKASTLANQTIMFTTPTGVTADDTIILTFNNSTSIPGALDFEDVDFSFDTTPDAVCETGDTQMTLAAAPSGGTMGVVDTSSTVLTFTNGSTAVAAGSEICIQVGTHATEGSTGVEQITNGSAGTTLLVISGDFGDSGTAALSIIADDQVVITATVAPTFTFTITDNTIGFSTLSSSAARWATGDGTGSATDTSAHDLTVATNAVSGYTVTYNGPTLTSGLNTINVASITNDADGTQGSEQFGLGISTDGNATIASGYDHNAVAGNRDWAWTASTTTTIASETVPTATETFSAYYLANIASNTESGSYTTTVTYVATANF